MIEPLVTIVTPVYNHELYLDDYFESIMSQTYQNIEVIIIDDASPDQSQKVIEKWIPELETRFKNVTYIPRTKNKGLISSCNEGLSLSKGKYICLFASDDIMMPENIYKKVNFLESNPRFGMVYSDGYYLHEFKSKLTLRYLYKKIFSRRLSQKQKHYSGDIKDILIVDNFIPSLAVCIRKECFKVVGGYSDKYYFEDYYMWVKISQHFLVGYIKEHLVKYRVHHNSMSNNPENIIKVADSRLDLLNSYKNRGIYNDETLSEAATYVNKLYAEYYFLKKEPENFMFYYSKTHKDWRIRLKYLYLKTLRTW